MAHILTISNHKGGAGKTSTCYNLADAFARRGLSVLCVDMDPQANLSSSLLVDTHPSTLRHTVAEMLLDTCSTEDAVIRDTTIPGVHLISGAIRLSGLEEKLRTDFSPATRLRDKTEILGKAYSIVIIDTPPSLGLLTANALTASDFYLLPMDSGSKWGLDGSNDFQDMVKRIRKINPKLRLAGVLLTRFDGRKTVCMEVEKVVQTDFDRVFESRISTSTNVQKSEMAQQTVLQLDRKSKSSREYANLADEVINLLGLQRKAKHRDTDAPGKGTTEGDE